MSSKNVCRCQEIKRKAASPDPEGRCLSDHLSATDRSEISTVEGIRTIAAHEQNLIGSEHPTIVPSDELPTLSVVG